MLKDYKLNQNYPNPFNPSIFISFTLAEKSLVSLKVYDLLEKEVATLVDAAKEAGRYGVTFDARELADGVYSYRL